MYLRHATLAVAATLLVTALASPILAADGDDLRRDLRPDDPLVSPDGPSRIQCKDHPVFELPCKIIYDCTPPTFHDHGDGEIHAHC